MSSYKEYLDSLIDDCPSSILESGQAWTGLTKAMIEELEKEGVKDNYRGVELIPFDDREKYPSFEFCVKESLNRNLIEKRLKDFYNGWSSTEVFYFYQDVEKKTKELIKVLKKNGLECKKDGNYVYFEDICFWVYPDFIHIMEDYQMIGYIRSKKEFIKYLKYRK